MMVGGAVRALYEWVEQTLESLPADTLAAYPGVDFRAAAAGEDLSGLDGQSGVYDVLIPTEVAGSGAGRGGLPIHADTEFAVIVRVDDASEAPRQTAPTAHDYAAAVAHALALGGWQALDGAPVELLSPRDSLIEAIPADPLPGGVRAHYLVTARFLVTLRGVGAAA